MTKKKSKNKFMSNYEYDLTWMAIRYAIGRNTISSGQLIKEVAIHAYNRMTPEDQILEAIDIRREIASKLMIYPFNFRMNSSISTGDVDYLPLEKFISWMDDNNITQPEDLNIWETIIYNGVNKYEAIQRDIPADYSTSDYNNLVPWAMLANFLDYRQHKFAKDEEGKVVEYFEAYQRISYKSYAYKKINISVEAFHNNPYSVIELKDITDITDKEAIKWYEENDLEVPVALTIEK